MRKYIPIIAVLSLAIAAFAGCTVYSDEVATTTDTAGVTTATDATKTAPADVTTPAATTEATTPTDADTAKQPVVTTTEVKSNFDATTMTGLLMKDGKMMIMMTDGSTKPMTEEITMPNGTKVSVEGKVTDAAGKEAETLKNDKWVKADGTY